MNTGSLDGPLQKHILLLKLSYEMKNRPNFVTELISDPDSVVRQWLVRVGAIMKRVSISDGVRWTSEVSMASRNWVRSVEALQSAAYGVIEDFKLDLELPNDAQIGRIYDQDQRLIFSADLLSIFGGAREDVFLIDP